MISLLLIVLLIHNSLSLSIDLNRNCSSPYSSECIRDQFKYLVRNLKNDEHPSFTAPSSSSSSSDNEPEDHGESNVRYDNRHYDNPKTENPQYDYRDDKRDYDKGDDKREYSKYDDKSDEKSYHENPDNKRHYDTDTIYGKSESRHYHGNHSHPKNRKFNTRDDIRDYYHSIYGKSDEKPHTDTRDEKLRDDNPRTVKSQYDYRDDKRHSENRREYPQTDSRHYEKSRDDDKSRETPVIKPYYGYRNPEADRNADRSADRSADRIADRNADRRAKHPYHRLRAQAGDGTNYRDDKKHSDTRPIEKPDYKRPHDYKNDKSHYDSPKTDYRHSSYRDDKQESDTLPFEKHDDKRHDSHQTENRSSKYRDHKYESDPSTYNKYDIKPQYSTRNEKSQHETRRDSERDSRPYDTRDYKLPKDISEEKPKYESPKPDIRPYDNRPVHKHDHKSHDDIRDHKRHYESRGNDRSSYEAPRTEVRHSDYRDDKHDYSVPKRDYDAPKRDYSTPKRDYDAPKPDYEVPKRDYDVPKRDYDAPKRDYDAPKQVYGVPKRDYGVPRRDYDIPKRESREHETRQSDIRDKRHYDTEEYKSPKESINDNRQYETPKTKNSYDDEQKYKNPHAAIGQYYKGDDKSNYDKPDDDKDDKKDYEYSRTMERNYDSRDKDPQIRPYDNPHTSVQYDQSPDDNNRYKENLQYDNSNRDGQYDNPEERDEYDMRDAKRQYDKVTDDEIQIEKIKNDMHHFEDLQNPRHFDDVNSEIRGKTAEKNNNNNHNYRYHNSNNQLEDKSPYENILNDKPIIMNETLFFQKLSKNARSDKSNMNIYKRYLKDDIKLDIVIDNTCYFNDNDTLKFNGNDSEKAYKYANESLKMYESALKSDSSFSSLSDLAYNNAIQSKFLTLFSHQLLNRTCDGTKKWDAIKSLPSIDVQKYINEKFENSTCENTEVEDTCDDKIKYRNSDGSCNNLEHPKWGRSFTCHRRLLPPDYADGIEKPRVSYDASPLPNSRVISNVLLPSISKSCKKFTSMTMAFGQFLVHDISRNLPFGQTIDCCQSSNQKHPECYPITPFPRRDFLTKLYNQTCISYTRTVSCNSCLLGPREQLNQATHILDMSQLYGATPEITLSLRSFNRGKLSSSLDMYKNEIPPVASDQSRCNSPPAPKDFTAKCFLTGDGMRGNQHPALQSLHTIFLRRHNQHAEALIRVNPHWVDEKLFQESRRILIAEWQKIVFGDYILALMGKPLSSFFGLDLMTHGYTKYDPSIDPSTIQEYIVAAGRYGHSQANSRFSVFNGGYKSYSYYLRDVFNDPSIVHYGHSGGVAKGLIVDAASEIDPYFVNDIKQFALRHRNESFGRDLPATSVQRGREHGVAGYVHYLDYCFGFTVKEWSDLSKFIDDERITIMKKVYKHWQDIDLFVGGISERKLDSAAFGPTFACINGIQFTNLKFGDRYYFEHEQQSSSFTQAQLDNIRHVTSLANILCKAAYIDSSQPNVFHLESAEENPVTKCNLYPELDYGLWKDEHSDEIK